MRRARPRTFARIQPTHQQRGLFPFCSSFASLVPNSEPYRRRRSPPAGTRLPALISEGALVVCFFCRGGGRGLILLLLRRRRSRGIRSALAPTNPCSLMLYRDFGGLALCIDAHLHCESTLEHRETRNPVLLNELLKFAFSSYLKCDTLDTWISQRWRLEHQSETALLQPAK